MRRPTPSLVGQPRRCYNYTIAAAPGAGHVSDLLRGHYDARRRVHAWLPPAHDGIDAAPDSLHAVRARVAATQHCGAVPRVPRRPPRPDCHAARRAVRATRLRPGINLAKTNVNMMDPEHTLLIVAQQLPALPVAVRVAAHLRQLNRRFLAHAPPPPINILSPASPWTFVFVADTAIATAGLMKWILKKMAIFVQTCSVLCCQISVGGVSSMDYRTLRHI